MKGGLRPHRRKCWHRRVKSAGGEWVVCKLPLSLTQKGWGARNVARYGFYMCMPASGAGVIHVRCMVAIQKQPQPQQVPHGCAELTAA